MQAGGAVRGSGTKPGRGRPDVLATIAATAVVATMFALLMLAAPISRNAAEHADPIAGASPAAVHDDAWNIPQRAAPSVIHDDAGYMHRDHDASGSDVNRGP